MSVRARQAAEAAQRGDGTDGARAAKARRSAWLLGGFAALFYVGYITWMFIRANGG